MNELKTLIKRIAEGDHASFEEFFKLTYKKIYVISMNILHDKALAEDAAQETYIKIMKKAGTFNPIFGNGITWISKIARNNTYDMLRKIKLEKTVPLKEELRSNWVLEDFVDDSIFKILNEEERLALELKIQKYKYSEISEETGLNICKITNLMKSARHKLEEYFAKHK